MRGCVRRDTADKEEVITASTSFVTPYRNNKKDEHKQKRNEKEQGKATWKHTDAKSSPASTKTKQTHNNKVEASTYEYLGSKRKGNRTRHMTRTRIRSNIG
eukprot:14091188-Heterocapsa_arctica.AAC.1